MKAWILPLIALAAAAMPTRPEAAPTAATPPCRQESPSTFVIEGPIDAAMAACVDERFSDASTELVVNSGGGDIRYALDMAERLERAKGLTVRVRVSCYSSCANYLLPLADRLVVEPGATIVLHGGVDPLFLQSDVADRREARVRELAKSGRLDRAEAEARYERMLAELRTLMERQRAFAVRHNVGLGWFLYREAGDTGVGRFLEGERGPRPHPFGWRYLLAEEPMVRSCLPEVEVVPFQAQLERDFIGNRARYGRFRRAEGLRSLHLRCAEPGGT